MGMWVVRIHVGRFGSTTDAHLKADKGAEKSCRKRRRVRGKRIGKSRKRPASVRSRVRHTRMPQKDPAPIPKESKERRMNRRMSAIDFFYGRVDQFDQLISQGSVMRRFGGSGRTRFSPIVYHELRTESDQEWYRNWRSRWERLHRHILRFGEEVIWCSRIGPSFSYHMEQRFRLVFKFSANHRPITANFGLQDMLLEVGLRAQDRRREAAKRRPSRLAEFQHRGRTVRQSLATPDYRLPRSMVPPSGDPNCRVCRSLPYRCDECPGN
jgi:hypothetical protein